MCIIFFLSPLCSLHIFFKKHHLEWMLQNVTFWSHIHTKGEYKWIESRFYCWQEKTYSTVQNGVCIQAGILACNRLLGTLFREECVYTVHARKESKLSNALLKEGFVHSPCQEESTVIKVFPMLVCFTWKRDYLRETGTSLFLSCFLAIKLSVSGMKIFVLISATFT